MRHLFLSALLATGLLVSPAYAQSTATPADPTVLSSDVAVSGSTFELPDPTSWEFFKRRFVHIFTFNETKRLEQELDLANLTLIAATDAAADGDTERAAKLLESFNVEMARLSAKLASVAGTLQDQTTDSSSLALLTKIQTDRLLQASALEQLSATTQAELQAKTLAARTDALRDLGKLLTAGTPSAVEFQARVEHITTKLSAREQKIERKITQRLAALEAIDEEVDEPELEDALDDTEDTALTELSALDQATLAKTITQIQASLGKHLIVLQALLDRLPTEARGSVEAILERGVEDLKTQLETDREVLKRLFDEDHESELYDKILERLSKETETAAESVKDTLESQREATKKALERERERAKKQAERAKEQESSEAESDDDGESSTESSGSSSSDDQNDDSESQEAENKTTSTTSGSSTSSTESSSERKTETKEIEIENGQFKTTRFEVETGTRLTIKLKNKDSVAHALAFVGSSATTGTVAAGGEKTVTIDVTGSMEYYCSLHAAMTHGTITAK